VAPEGGAMIASWRGLAVAAAIAAVLAVIVIVDTLRAGGAVAVDQSTRPAARWKVARLACGVP